MTTVPFHPIVLVSSVSLPRFLAGTEEVAAIIQAGQNPAALRLSDRWDVVCLAEVKELFHLCYGLILLSCKCLCDALCLSDLSKRAWVLACHEMTDGTLLRTQQVFQNNFLARSVNACRKDIADFYLQEPRLQYSLPGPGNNRVFDLQFFYGKGVCKGMCHWFVSLYFKTQHLFTDPKEHLRALGTQFEQGASRQAAFLQLPLHTREFCNFLNLNCHPDILAINSQGMTCEQLIQDIRSCPSGVYGVYIANHQIIYIKSDDGQEFFFDPNKGVLKIDSLFLFKYVIARYFKQHDPQKTIFVDRYSSSSP